MSADAKFRTVLPNNNMKGDVAFTPVAEVYQEKTNTFGQREDFMWANDIKIAMSGQPYSGGSGTAQIPPTFRLLGPMFLNFKFTCVDDRGSATWRPLRVNCNYAAYNLLRTFGYRLPGCDRTYLENYNMPYKHIEDCETLEKVQKLQDLAGKKGAYKYANAGMSFVDRTTSMESTGIGNGKTQVLTMLMPLPWSSTPALGTSRAPKPFPAHLTTQPLELYFQFNDFASVISNFQAQPPLVANGTWQLAGVEISFLYGTLADPIQYKNTKYFYQTLMPFDHIYNFTYKIPAAGAGGGVQNSENPGGYSIPLRGLRNGEIRELMFHVGDSADAVGNPYKSVEVGKISLLYAGQKIWSTDYRNHQLMEMLFDTKTSFEPPNKRLIRLNNIRGVTGVRDGTFTDHAGAVSDADYAGAHANTMYSIGTRLDTGLTPAQVNNGEGLGMVDGESVYIYTDVFDNMDDLAPVPAGNLAWRTQGALTNAKLAKRKQAPTNVFYRIPIASALTNANVFPGYALGADFKDADLTLVLDDIRVGEAADGTVFNVYCQFRYNSQILFDGQTCTVDW